MSIEIREVRSKKDLRNFIHLPAKIHANHKNWLPPVYLDEWAFFNSTKNKSFQSCDTLLLLAFENSKLAGRIMGIVHNQYNAINEEQNARFSFLECYDRPAVSEALLNAVESWAKAKGMTKIIGPYGFSDKDPQGLMIEGFDYPPVLAAPCNLPFLVHHIEHNGYQKELDCLMFRFEVNTELPDIYQKIYHRVSENPVYRVLEFTRKKDLYPYIVPILQMMNEAYKHIYGFVPLTEKEMKDLARRYMPVIDPRFVKTIICEGEVVAFILGLPNMTRGLQKAGGHLNPWTLFNIWWSAKTTRQLDLMLGGVRPDHQGRGLEVLMALKLIDSAKEAEFTKFEVHLVLEQNRPMIAQMKKVGAIAHKRFRVFQKELK